MKNIKKYKLLLLLGSIFLIYFFSNKLFGETSLKNSKISETVLKKIQTKVKENLFNLLSANELTTKEELDKYITNSQNSLSLLKKENKSNKQNKTTKAKKTPAPEPTPPVPAPEPTPPVPAPEPTPPVPAPEPTPPVPAPVSGTTGGEVAVGTSKSMPSAEMPPPLP